MTSTALKPISFVYFDVGGIVIKDFSATQKWYQMLHDLGLDAQDLDRFNQYWSSIKLQLEKGSYDLDANLEELSQIGAILPPKYSMIQDFVNRFEPNQSLWPIIDSLKKKGMLLGLLTNMYPHLFEAINNAKLYPPAKWDIIIDSSVVGLHKPDPKIYHLAQQKAATPPDQILFIDNTKENLPPAQHLGWQTFWYDSCNYQKSSHQLTVFLKANL